MAPKKRVSKTELRAKKALLRARLSDEVVVDGGVDVCWRYALVSIPHSQMKVKVSRMVQEPQKPVQLSILT